MSDYLAAFDGNDDDFLKRFDDAAPAPERKPLPGGVYVAKTIKGEMTKTKTTGKDAYRITFEVLEPAAFAGRTIARTWVFTPAAIAYARRDLGVFKLDSGSKLLQPFPDDTVFVCKLFVALQRSNEGSEFNDLKQFTVVRTEPRVPNPFAAGGGDAAEPEGGKDGTDFPFGANEGGKP